MGFVERFVSATLGQRVFVLLCLGALVVSGVEAFRQLPVEAFPDLTKPKKKLSSIPGYPPRLDALPAGCRFAPRCPLAFDRCRTEQPLLHKIDDAQSAVHIASCHLLEASK